MKEQEIWLFCERPGVWGLRVDGVWWEVSSVDVLMPMASRHRSPRDTDELEYPRAYLEGHGVAHRVGNHVYLEAAE